MTPEEQDNHWHTFNSFQQKMERKYYPALNRALKAQIESYIKNQSLNYVISTGIHSLLVRLYNDAGVRWAHKATMNLPKLKERRPMGFSERIVQLMKDYYGLDILNTSEGITTTTREFIQQVLSDAASEGFGFDEIVYRLRNTELTAIRARMIARTETVTAANGASVLAAKDTGLALNKIWISVRDNRTRHSHRVEDNTVIDIDQPFTVGLEGAQMMQPGARKQPNGLDVDPKEYINCRCTLGMIPKRGRDGRLVRA